MKQDFKKWQLVKRQEKLFLDIVYWSLSFVLFRFQRLSVTTNEFKPIFMTSHVCF